MTGYRVVGDWGTSRLRLFRVEGATVVDRCEGPGIAALKAPPEDALRAMMRPWQATAAPDSISLCGMIGSRNGWIDVPYVECPADLAHWRRGAATLRLDGVPVSIMAGLATTDTAGVPDVMRGEETQIFGATALDPELGRGRRVIALPGTHSKWAVIDDGRVDTFRTFLTGELFALLRDHSTLARAAVAADSDPAEQGQGFDEGLVRAEESGHLLGTLFSARAMQLRAGRSRAWAIGFMSGLIIGREVAEATERLPALKDVALVGDPGLATRYSQALSRRGIAASRHDGDACALAGLTLAETLA